MYNELDYRYHARNIQIRSLENLLDSITNAEVQQADEQLRGFTGEFKTSKIVVNNQIPHIALVRFQDLYLHLIQTYSKRIYTITILEKLVLSTNKETRATVIVELDESKPSSIYQPLGLPVANFDHGLTIKDRNNADQDGKHSAINELLIKIQKPRSTRLLRYTCDQLHGLIPLHPTFIGKGAIGYLPTSVEGVDLRYFYFSPDAHPQLSLLVQKLEDEPMSAQKPS